MSDKDHLAEMISSLKQQRDELALQIHLGKAEAKEEWERLEGKLNEITEKAKEHAQPLSGAVEEAVEEAGEQAKKVADAVLDLAASELKEGYEKLKRMLK